MKIQVHATNIHGIGASNVVQNLLLELIPMLSKKYAEVIIYKSSKLKLDSQLPENVKVHVYKRYCGRTLSRFFELTLSRFFFNDWLTITLGDIPLRGIHEQILLVHQSNLIKRSVNHNTNKSFSFKLQRLIFSINHKNARKIIVQSPIMKDGLIKSYGISEDRIFVHPNPVDKRFLNIKNSTPERLVLFYPSSFYFHKNHKLLFQLNDLDSLHSIDQILLTISKKELPNNLSSKFVATDQLSISDCIELYKNSSALIFPSLMESYGLPLIEAMYLDLPILVSKLPYAEWICGEQALYFDPYNIDSLKNCIKLFQQKLHDGWKPDYSEQLKKIPMDWHSFSQLFFN